jgi:hypothetical protein
MSAELPPTRNRREDLPTLPDRGAQIGASRIGTVVLATNPEGHAFAITHGFEIDRYKRPRDTVEWIGLEREIPD